MSDIETILNMNYTAYNFEEYLLQKSEVKYFQPKAAFGQLFYRSDESKIVIEKILQKFDDFNGLFKF